MVRSAESIDEGSTENGSAGDASRPRHSGRPRDDALDEAIILATRDRLVRDGYSNMTIGDIAGMPRSPFHALFGGGRTNSIWLSMLSTMAFSSRPKCTCLT